jgi:hypothetical protein
MVTRVGGGVYLYYARCVDSVAGAIAYLTNHGTPEQLNGAVWTMSSIINVVVSSAAEAEYAALFMGAQQAVWLRTVLEAMGYPQLPTPILCDNTCALGIATDSVKLKRTKSIDMRFHWVRDRVRQLQLKPMYIQSKSNAADFYTKFLLVQDHLAIMPYLVVTPGLTARPIKNVSLN